MARLKHVYHTSEIPHLWAHGIDRDIRNSLKNLYTEGDTIYSYGSHFPIARRVVVKDGSIVFLMTTRTYSVTTNGHIRAVRSAMRGVGTVIEIDPDATGGRGTDALWYILANRKGSSKPIVEWYQWHIANCEEAAAKPRIRYTTRESKIGEAGRWYAKWVETHTVFKLRISIDAVKRPQTVDETRAKYAKQHKAQAARDLLSAEKQRVKDTETARVQAGRAEQAKSYIGVWRQIGGTPALGEGETVSMSDLGYPILRIAGEQVISSMGARVSIADAKSALRCASVCVGRGYNRDAITGAYRGFGATESHMRIGCHSIPWHEVRSFCEYYGWDIPDGIPA